MADGRLVAGGRWLLPGVAAVLLLPSTAEAHTALRSMGSFWSAVAHLLTSLDQACFLVGLAIWASFLDRRLDARVLGTVFAALFAGVLVGALAEPAARLDAPAIVAAAMTLAGLAGAVRLRLGFAPVLGLASLGGAASGVAAGRDAAGAAIGLFSLGSAIAGAAVLSYGLLATRRVEVEWGRIALRAVASWIAAIGVILVAFELAYPAGQTSCCAG